MQGARWDTGASTIDRSKPKDARPRRTSEHANATTNESDPTKSEPTRSEATKSVRQTPCQEKRARSKSAPCQALQAPQVQLQAPPVQLQAPQESPPPRLANVSWKLVHVQLPTEMTCNRPFVGALSRSI